MSKKWCKFCRVNIDFNRDAIRKHEETRLHLQNQEKEINHQRRLAKKDHKKIPSGITLQIKNSFQQEPTVPQVSSAQEKREEFNRMKAQVMDQVKSKIHTFIAEKTQGKFGAIVDYPEAPLLTTQKYNDNPKLRQLNSDSNSDGEQEQEFKMWRMAICQQSNKPCFINNITGAKLYQKPTGVVLNEQEIEQWEQLQKQVGETQQEQKEVHIGVWQEVEANEDFFVVNAFVQKQESDQSQSADIDPEGLQDLNRIRESILKTTTVADKSRLMKKIVESGREDVALMNSKEDSLKDDQDLKQMKGFLPRKRVKGVTIMAGQEFE